MSRIAARSAGTITGVVTARETGKPLPLALVTLVGADREVLTDGDGQFVFDSVSFGDARVRVRHIGFTSMELQVSVSAISGGTESVSMGLIRVAPAASSAKSDGQLYCGTTFDAPKPRAEVQAILEQMLGGAERNRFLVRTRRYLARYDLIYNLHTTRKGTSLGDERRSDVASRSSARPWRYVPGDGGYPLPDHEGFTEVSNLLELADVADEPFLANHCWRYRGSTTVDGDRLLRLDFEPIRTLKAPDMTGSVFLDPASYEVRRMTLELSRTFPGNEAIDERIALDTRYREYQPGIPMLDRLLGRLLRKVSPPCREVDVPLPGADTVTTKSGRRMTSTMRITDCPPAVEYRTEQQQQFTGIVG